MLPLTWWASRQQQPVSHGEAEESEIFVLEKFMLPDMLSVSLGYGRNLSCQDGSINDLIMSEDPTSVLPPPWELRFNIWLLRGVDI